MATTADPRTWLGLSWLAAVPLLAGCAPDSRRGGQSGTEGGGGTICARTESHDVTPEEVLRHFGRSLNDLTASIAAPVMWGRWLSTGKAAELSVVIPPGGSARQISELTDEGTICSSILELDTLTVRSSEGAVDAQVPARLTSLGSPDQLLMLDAVLPPLPDGYLGPAAWGPDAISARNVVSVYNLEPIGGSPALRMAIAPDFFYANAAIFDGQEITGLWTTQSSTLLSGPPIPYTPSEQFALACAGAETFAEQRQAYTPFLDAAAALEGMTGTWLRCQDNAVSSHAALRILPDGSWHHVELEGDELVARFGFEHEGFLDIFYESTPSIAPDTQNPGPYAAELRPFGRRYEGNALYGPDMTTGASEDALVFNQFGPNWPAAVYLPTTAPVRTTPPEYASGERAGAAACDHGERGVVATLEELAPLLSGDFVLCSGTLRDGVARIHFGEASLTLLRADGTVILMHAYDEPISALLADTRFQYPPELDWWVEVSRSPLKLWINESRETRSNVAVFSALP